MNILCVSPLTGHKYSGLTVAVPKHIQAQAKINNVFWLNTCVPNRDLSVPGAVCHTLQQYPIDLSSLPDPFNKPDLIIFHSFYLPSFLKLAKQARKMRIPYIIVPHGSLTRHAMSIKCLKKKIANCLFSIVLLIKRKALLEAIRYVDLVIPETCWEQKRTDIHEYHIDTFVIGDDWSGKFDFLKEEGAQVVYVSRTPEISTTQIKQDLHHI